MFRLSRLRTNLGLLKTMILIGTTVFLWYAAFVRVAHDRFDGLLGYSGGACLGLLLIPVIKRNLEAYKTVLGVLWFAMIGTALFAREWANQHTWAAYLVLGIYLHSALFVFGMYDTTRSPEE